MSSNLTVPTMQKMHFKNVVLDAYAYALPEDVWSSERIENTLAPLYDRLKLPQGRLEMMTGIRERRHWSSDFLPSDAAILAGKALLQKSGFPKADIDILINGISARKFGSQGQQRSAVLALKLGEANVLKEKTGEQPIALLDDVMSELDEQRQDYILHHIDGWQVFITCCDPHTILRLKEGKTFHIAGGKLLETTEPKT